MPDLRAWFTPLGLLLAAVAAGLAVRFFVQRSLKSYFERSPSRFDDLILTVLGRHVPLWFLLAGISLGAQSSPLSEAPRALIHKLVVSGLFVSLTLGGARLLSEAVRVWTGPLTQSAATTTLMETLVRLAVIGMGAMLILSNLGISITPILTALGVGSLAVALALQDTLANFFAGIHLVAARLIEVGDFIKLEGGQEGTVIDIGWRATRLRELANNTILIPNAKLAQSIIVNFQDRDAELAVLVPMAARYGADLKRVEELAVAAAAEVQKTVKGAVPKFEPFVRYGSFGESSIGFNVILRAQTYPDRFLVTHEFIKRAHELFTKAGIEAPLPQRVVHDTRRN